MANLPRLLVYVYLVCFGCTLTSIWARPLSGVSNSTSFLQRRQCVTDPQAPGNYICDDELPTLADLVARMRDVSQHGQADAQHIAVFYTNLNDPNLNGPDPSGADPTQAWMHTWLLAHNLQDQYYWWGDSLDIKWFEAQVEWIDANPTLFQPRWGDDGLKVIARCLYEALGAAAVNPDAMLFTPKDVDWGTDSLWHQLEYPALTRNPNIQRIWRVDPRPPQLRGIHPPLCLDDEPELVWDRSRGDGPYSDAHTDTCKVV